MKPCHNQAPEKDTNASFKHTLIATAIAVALTASEAEAANKKAFQINLNPVSALTRSSNIAYKTTAMASDGSFFVATWIDAQGLIVFRKLDQNGGPLSNEVTVGNIKGSPQDSQPQIAMDDAGNFVIVWGNTIGEIYVRLFTASGTPQGEAITVTQDGSRPFVAMDAAGNFTVAWNKASSSPPNIETYTKRYDQTGASVGDLIKIAGEGWLNSLNVDDTGNFILTFSSPSNSGSIVQRFDVNGVAVGGPISDAGIDAGVAMDADGDFVVVATEADYSGGDYSYKLKAKLYDRAGNPRKSINVSSSEAVNPIVAMDATGNFIINFTSYSGYKPKLKCYNWKGKPAKAKPNTDSVKADFNAVAMSDRGRFVGVWQEGNRLLGLSYKLKKFK